MRYQQKLKPDLEIERVLDKYSLRPREEEKKKEERYSEKKVFEMVKTTEKVSSKTKELEFGGRFGMCANFSNSRTSHFLVIDHTVL